MTTRLFVYGTLMPGCEAWPLLARWTYGDARPDVATGTLFDTGRGYPCATFHDDASHTVHGVVVDLDPQRSQTALATLDAYEAEEYDRIVIRTHSGADAFTYAWVAPLDGSRRWRTAVGPAGPRHPARPDRAVRAVRAGVIFATTPPVP